MNNDGTDDYETMCDSLMVVLIDNSPTVSVASAALTVTGAVVRGELCRALMKGC